MKIAIVGSRSLTIDNLAQYLPDNIEEIISGGAKGIDMAARAYAEKNAIRLLEFLPDYRKFGKAAPFVRNKAIVEAADFVLAFWDGESRGTKNVIENCRRNGVPFQVICLAKGI